MRQGQLQLETWNRREQPGLAPPALISQPPARLLAVTETWLHLRPCLLALNVFTSEGE